MWSILSLRRRMNTKAKKALVGMDDKNHSLHSDSVILLFNTKIK